MNHHLLTSVPHPQCSPEPYNPLVCTRSLYIVIILSFLWSVMVDVVCSTYRRPVRLPPTSVSSPTLPGALHGNPKRLGRQQNRPRRAPELTAWSEDLVGPPVGPHALRHGARAGALCGRPWARGQGPKFSTRAPRWERPTHRGVCMTGSGDGEGARLALALSTWQQAGSLSPPRMHTHHPQRGPGADGARWEGFSLG